ncbi:hypothetical protein Ddc_12177 [Ditylenchus destructor]|nr:hypothetical protein Ddc_12177 [Ditylenchus destructor]
MSKANQSKRIAFTEEDDASMWEFFLEKLKRRDLGAVMLRQSIWMEYVVTCAPNHHYNALEKHFRDIMLPRIHKAQIPDKDIVLVIKLCNFTLDNNEAASRLKKRLKKYELTIEPNLFVKKIVRKGM